jgi:hypothetical protein
MAIKARTADYSAGRLADHFADHSAGRFGCARFSRFATPWSTPDCSKIRDWPARYVSSVGSPSGGQADPLTGQKRRVINVLGTNTATLVRDLSGRKSLHFCTTVQKGRM